jgi:hypothetical protein
MLGTCLIFFEYTLIGSYRNAQYVICIVDFRFCSESALEHLGCVLSKLTIELDFEQTTIRQCC